MVASAAESSQYFQDKIQVTVEKSGFAAIISRLFGPPRLHKDLHAERELVFCIAASECSLPLLLLFVFVSGGGGGDCGVEGGSNNFIVIMNLHLHVSSSECLH